MFVLYLVSIVFFPLNMVVEGERVLMEFFVLLFPIVTQTVDGDDLQFNHFASNLYHS